MNKRNVTISLPRDLIQKAKIQAAREDKSLSRFMKEALEEKIRKETGFEEARRRQSRLLREGIDLGTKGKVSVTRNSLHER